MTAQLEPQDDLGFTLIEVLVALVILGTAVTALITGLAVNAKTTLGNKNQSQASASLGAAAEYVKALSWSALPACGAAASVDITQAQVSHDAGLTLSYSVTKDQSPILGSSPCAVIRLVTVRVSGNGFDLSTDVLRRPVDAP